MLDKNKDARGAGLGAGQCFPTYELGERFPSGLIFCCATPSPMTTGSLADVALAVADAGVLRSIGRLWDGGASVGYTDFGLVSRSEWGGASGGAGAAATDVDMMRWIVE